MERKECVCPSQAAHDLEASSEQSASPALDENGNGLSILLQFSSLSSEAHVGTLTTAGTSDVDRDNLPSLLGVW